MINLAENLYWYKAKVIKVIDGDTIDVAIDVGFRATRTERLRFAEIDAFETRGKERAKGLEAKQFVIDWIEADGPDVIIRTQKGDAFGRWIAHIYRADSVVSLNTQLVDAGLAVYKTY